MRSSFPSAAGFVSAGRPERVGSGANELPRVHVDKALTRACAPSLKTKAQAGEKYHLTWAFSAEGVGFEPTEPGGSTVFETVRGNRSP